MALTAVILAAGQGTRMRSSLPKVLHPLAGHPLIEYSLRLAKQLGSDKPVVVVGHRADQVRQVVGEAAYFAVQEPQLGTAHAVQAAEPLLKEQKGSILVVSADMPLLTFETLHGLVEAQQHNSGPISMLTMVLSDSHGFGRIVRGKNGSVIAIVEEAQATPEQLAIQELNVGAYCFASEWLWSALKRVPLSPKGEYYLTDVIGIAAAEGLQVQAITVQDPHEAIGINTRVHLAEAEEIMRRRINTAWMASGVTMVDPSTTYIEPDVTIGQDTVLYPNSNLHGNTEIGVGCTIGPNTLIRDSRVGNGCKIIFSVVEQAGVEDGKNIGPFEYVGVKA
jgi:bifunctional UDP-N-acetylglucosamine pyrophosphorylase / glucosamine-1-phosphate N-acetyltransferase